MSVDIYNKNENKLSRSFTLMLFCKLYEFYSSTLINIQYTHMHRCDERSKEVRILVKITTFEIPICFNLHHVTTEISKALDRLLKC